jgi:hypothetical protein
MQVTVRSTGDLKAVNRALREAANGKELRKQLTKQLKVEMRPMVASVKAAWLSAPSQGRPSGAKIYSKATGRATGKRGPGLRKLLAKATAGQVRMTGKEAGIRVRTDGRKMPSGMKALPGYAEGIRRRPWRHPVFGDREVWVTQQSFPRFYDAVQPDEARARQACVEAVETVLNQIARAT